MYFTFYWRVRGASTRISASGEIVCKTSAGATDHVMGTAFTGFFRLGILKNVTEEFGVHFLYCNIVHFLEVLNIPQFESVERKTIEAIPFGVDIHRAVIGASQV